MAVELCVLLVVELYTLVVLYTTRLYVPAGQSEPPGTCRRRRRRPHAVMPTAA